jgi:hypothetical protein
MAGALLLARATEGAPLSVELLAAARERLLPAGAQASASTPSGARPAPRRKSPGA